MKIGEAYESLSVSLINDLIKKLRPFPYHDRLTEVTRGYDKPRAALGFGQAATLAPTS
jgi:hypothetical protein